MLKNLSLSYKLYLAPAIALLGLVLFVIYTSTQLAATDKRLVSLEIHSYPTLEKADAIIFQFSRLPGMLNSAVAAGEQATLDEAREVLQQVSQDQRSLMTLIEAQPQHVQQLEAWRAGVTRYAENALSASEQLIGGNASFDDLRPSLDRMATDLEKAQTLGAGFRDQAYDDFRQTLV